MAINEMMLELIDELTDPSELNLDEDITDIIEAEAESVYDAIDDEDEDFELLSNIITDLEDEYL